MIKLIIDKELREIIGSTKFAITFAVCSVLILLTFYVGAKNYQVNMAQYRAAMAENLRQMEGLTDWLRVNSHRIFLPPQPLEALVTGISNDIGHTIEMIGQGELAANDSRFSDDPIFAVFRFLDLDFIFQIVLSLFAIVFGYDAINGEKERGTLRLAFARPIPRANYILGKITGYFMALTLPLLIPILLGCLILPVLGIQLTLADWFRLGLVLMTGVVFFSVFLTLSVLVSTLTHRSSSSFLLLLVIWIFTVLIIPRTAVLLAGRAVAVSSVDDLNFQKNALRSQLWNEDRKKLGNYQPEETGNIEKMMNDFNKFMQDLADEREKKLQDLASRLNEQRRNQQRQQEQLAFGLARISPAAAFSLAIGNLVGTSIGLKEHFLDEATGYQQAYGQFIKEKTGMNLGGRVMIMRVRADDADKEKPIDPKELPAFAYKPMRLTEVVNDALLDLGLLVLFNILFFAGAFVAFLRYDLR